VNTVSVTLARTFAVSLIGATLALPLAASADTLAVNLNLVKTGVVIALTPEQAIENKAVSLGAAFTGAKVSGLETVPGGFRIRFQKCDIYYSTTTGAHEVHGEIRDKYNFVGGAAVLGLPIDDEKPGLDGVGRKSHFTNDASIFFKSNTGPMVVKGDVRFVWTVFNAERGVKGYPTIDGRVLGPNQAFGDFENDVIYTEGPTEVPTEVATLTRAQVSRAVYNMWWAHTFDLGQMVLEDVSITHIGNTGKDFLQSLNRAITFHLKGKWVRPLWFDSDWSMDIHLRFFAVKEADGSTSLRVKLLGQTIDASDSVESKLQAQLDRTFGSTSSSTKLISLTIPAAVPVLSFKVHDDGRVQLYLQPVGGAPLVQLAVQLAFDRLAK
jgi:hypothetical protein